MMTRAEVRHAMVISTWELLQEVDDLMANTPGWVPGDWKKRRKKSINSLMASHFAHDKRRKKNEKKSTEDSEKTF